jgi:hypothetical protein
VPREAFTDNYYVVMLRSLTGLKRMDEVKALASEFRQSNSSAAPETQAEFALWLAHSGLHDEALSILEAARQNAPESCTIL